MKTFISFFIIFIVSTACTKDDDFTNIAEFDDDSFKESKNKTHLVDLTNGRKRQLLKDHIFTEQEIEELTKAGMFGLIR